MLDTMTVLVAVAALTLAATVGYIGGRRSNSRPATWRHRTSTVALGKRAAVLVALIAVRRCRRQVRHAVGARRSYARGLVTGR